MTSKINFPGWVVGLMSGTSCDGVDAALLFTDGRELVQPGPSLTIPYSDELRASILGLMKGIGMDKARQVEEALTLVHIDAVEKLRSQIQEPVVLVGFHGQTIRHAPKRGITLQIGGAKLMADRTGLPVIADFRTNDVRQGGHGAPMVPLYHAALTKDLPKPVMIVNIGGVANVTWVGEERREATRSPDDHHIIAFDCGPGNALIDDWLNLHTKARFDEEGRVAAAGRLDGARMTPFLNDPFFKETPPKSLDRQHFSLELVKGLSLENGAATLTAMTAAGIARACELVPQTPKQLLVTGGGRHNPTLMAMIEKYAAVKAAPVETMHWQGDALEAQAFAYLAARSMQGLALTLPSTTGVPRPVTGGVFYPAGRVAAT